MKNVLLVKLLLATTILKAQPIVQPVSSGDYWTTDEYQSRLPELVNKTTFPATVNFTNGYAGINSLEVNRLVGANEIIWNVGTVQNVSDFVIEWSRDLKTFERAGIVQLARTDNGNRYVFKHLFDDNKLVYYRIGFVSGGQVLAYTKAVQVLDEEFTTKIFPTIVKGSTFYIQSGKAFEKVQVVNSSGQSMYEKGLDGTTGTITIVLPSSLQKGIYFVRLLSANQPQHVQRIMVE